MTERVGAGPGVAHGGSMEAARRLFPDALMPLLDLSTGINPVPYPLPPLAPECFARLPEAASVAALEQDAARAYGLADAAMVVAAPGTQILINLLPLLWPMGSVAVLGPTYAEHARSWLAAGSDVAACADLNALGEADSAVVCNPNNPDGRRIAPATLLGLADRIGARGGLLVVDEAFVDLEPGGLSIAGALPRRALVVLRSFGKTYGLAGLRLGFALAAPERAAAIRDALGPWAVSGPAIAIGRAALADQPWLEAASARLAGETASLDGILRAAGLAVLGGTSLFRLTESDHVAAIFARLGRAGIFVRRFADHPRWLRFGQPGSAEALERLRMALAPAAG